MLNIDLKIISKDLSEKLKEVISELISSQQTTYVKKRHIGNGVRTFPPEENYLPLRVRIRVSMSVRVGG